MGDFGCARPLAIVASIAFAVGCTATRPEAASVAVPLAPGPVDAGADAFDPVPDAPPDAAGADAGIAVACDIDLSRVEAIEAYDFELGLGLPADTAAEAKAWTVAAVEIAALAKKVDALLVSGCGDLARDLGSPGSFADAVAACNAAHAAFGNVFQAAGRGSTLTGARVEARCGAPVDAYADCLAKCDPRLAGGVALLCGPGALSGACGGSCHGSCDLAAPSTCRGVCSGSCDAGFAGTCIGTCTGTCDGVRTGGTVCPGTCNGRCAQGASGTCRGQCSGACQLDVAAPCSGTCSGQCSVALAAPACGSVTGPKASVACSAKCDAWAANVAKCTPAHESISISSSPAPAAAAKLRAALSVDSPQILLVTHGLGQLLAAVLDDADRLHAAPRHPCTAPALDAAASAVTAIRADLHAADGIP